MISWIIPRLMPILVLVFAVAAILFPSPFSLFHSLVDYSLGFILFIMGVTLDLQRLRSFLKKPALPIIGFAGKWTILFALSYLLANIFFPRDAQLAGGVILTGVVPSGTSANLFALLGGGDLALSVTMSALDTLVGPGLTPVLAHWGMGAHVAFALRPFAWKMFRIVFIPLFAGCLLQFFARRLPEGTKKVAPILSSVALYIVVVGVVSRASAALLANRQLLAPLFLVAVLQVLVPMATGYLYARLWKLDERSCRSILFEVGIPNAALAAVLASTQIGPLAGLFAIINMVCNLTLGAMAAMLLASWHQKS